MLDVLAADRNLQSVIKETKPMLRMRIEEFAAYEMGMEKEGRVDCRLDLRNGRWPG